MAGGPAAHCRAIFSSSIGCQRRRRRELRPATLAQYEGVVEHWILPKLGGTKVAALTPAAVVDFMAALRSEPTAKGRKGLSARSTQLAAGVLKAACAFAVSTEMIGRNPIAGVRRPRAEGQAIARLERR